MYCCEKVKKCFQCPRNCCVDRSERAGYCGVKEEIYVAGTMLHHWEEPCISGHPEKGKGSGTIFFSGCPLHCVFCQNSGISHSSKGEHTTIADLAEKLLSLQEQGAYNINLVSPTQYSSGIREALLLVKHQLKIPVVWNTGGYESSKTIESLRGLVDIFLTDFKFGSERTGRVYAKAPNYAEEASKALGVMVDITGDAQFGVFGDEDQVPHVEKKLLRGTIVRHLVLPGETKDSIAVLQQIEETVGHDSILLALMSQYTPSFVDGRDDVPKALHRKVTTLEMQRVQDEAIRIGFHGYCQDRSAAKKTFTPSFVL